MCWEGVAVLHKGAAGKAGWGKGVLCVGAYGGCAAGPGLRSIRRAELKEVGGGMLPQLCLGGVIGRLKLLQE
jgi:hypothetical protein